MTKNIYMTLSFVAGLVLGAAITNKVVEKKYQDMADEEIQSVIDTFKKRETTSITDQDDDLEVEGETKELDRFAESSNNGLLTKYQSEVDRINYDKISTQNIKPKRGKKKKEEIIEEPPKKRPIDHIYIISPDEFKTIEAYSTTTYYYSSDRMLFDENCIELSNSEIERTIDHDPYGHFGEYEDDAVYVRNDELMCDYEILLSDKTGAEIMEG